MSRNAPSLFSVAGIIAALLTLGCSDASRTVAPSDRPSRTTAAGGGANMDHYEPTGSIDQDLAFECLDEPIRFVVSYTWTFDVTNTPSGISSVKSAFIV